jgi:toxin CcdB
MRATVPLVVVQSSLFDGYRRRVVVPLVLRSALPSGAKVADTRMNPVFRIKDIDDALSCLKKADLSGGL